MRAAIDIGSNSIRLLILTDDGRLFEQSVLETRLGDGFADGRLHAAAIARTLDALSQFCARLHELAAEEVILFATSAVRDAENREELLTAARSELGQSIRVLSGEEEADYAFRGAVGGFDFAPEECLLIDIGGGSTEVAVCPNGHPHGVSVPMGAVRYKVTAAQPAAVRALLTDKLSALPAPDTCHVIGVGGTITTAAAILYAVTDYSRAAVHGRTIDRPQLAALTARLAALTEAERKSVIGLPPARSDIILYGLDILAVLFDLFQIEKLHVSDHGILDGILREKA